MYRNTRQRPSGSSFLRPAGQQPRKKKITKPVGSVFAVIGIACIVSLLLHFTKEPDTTSKAVVSQASNSKPSTVSTPTNSVPAGFNKSEHSTTDPASIWIIVNKQHPLSPKTYQPKDLVIPNIPLRSNITGDERQLRSEPAKALEAMAHAAASEGITINQQSGYRSYNFQVNLYNSYVKQQGQAAADRSSARPGYSEHQSGLAVDVGGTSQPACNVSACFSNTSEGKWVTANAYKYGFIIRYTATQESVTGYEYEPWHLRYVGTGLAGEMHQRGIETLEQYFGVSGGTKY